MSEKPHIGLVIRHLYLWRGEARKGRDEGRKARPCVIVHTYHNEHEETEVYIAPITHTQPYKLSRAKEIPLETKQRLGLDHARSWIITDEVNRFTWKGPDVRKTPSGEFAYGHLPPGLTRAAIEQIRNHARERDLGVVGRDDETLSKQLRQRKQARRTRTKDRDQ